MLPQFILHNDPDDPVLEVIFPDGQNVFYSLDGIPPEQWELTIAAMRREAQDKVDRGELVDSVTFVFKI